MILYAAECRYELIEIDIRKKIGGLVTAYLDGDMMHLG